MENSEGNNTDERRLLQQYTTIDMYLGVRIHRIAHAALRWYAVGTVQYIRLRAAKTGWAAPGKADRMESGNEALLCRSLVWSLDGCECRCLSCALRIAALWRLRH